MKGCLRFAALLLIGLVVLALLSNRPEDRDRGPVPAPAPAPQPPPAPTPTVAEVSPPAPTVAPSPPRPAEVIQAALDARLLELDGFKADPAFHTQGYARPESKYVAWRRAVEGLRDDPGANPYQASAAWDLLNLATAYRIAGGRETEGSKLARSEFWKDFRQAKRLVAEGWQDPARGGD